MNRVFTDPRFPGFEVHNDGKNVFRVYERSGGQLQEIDTFTTYSDHPEYRIPDEAAERRAKDYFERMANGQMGHELSDGGEFGDNRAPGGIESAPPAENPEGEFTGPASLDSMVGDDQVLTYDDVLAAYDRAKAIQDPKQQEAALAQVKAMAAQMESSAQELVRRLLN